MSTVSCVTQSSATMNDMYTHTVYRLMNDDAGIVLHYITSALLRLECSIDCISYAVLWLLYVQKMLVKNVSKKCNWVIGSSQKLIKTN